MNEVINTGSREKKLASFPAVIGTALITVTCLHFLPVLFLFFSVPLVILYFRANTYTYLFSVFFTFILSVFFSVITILPLKLPFNFDTVLLHVFGSSIFILPLFCLVLPEKVRFRYRIALAGMLSSIFWAFLFLYSEAGPLLIELLRNLSNQTADLLYSMLPEGFDRTTFMVQTNPDFLFSRFLDSLMFTIMPGFIGMFAFGCFIGVFIASKIRGSVVTLLNLRLFFNDFFMFYPLVGGMVGVIGGRILDSRLITVVSWNIGLSAGMFFILQGAGLLRFFMSLLRKKTGKRHFLGFLLFVILLAFNGWLFFLGGLLIAGVVELFIPLRKRFDNNDIIDPTPGRGNDHT